MLLGFLFVALFCFKGILLLGLVLLFWSWFVLLVVWLDLLVGWVRSWMGSWLVDFVCWVCLLVGCIGQGCVVLFAVDMVFVLLG